MLIIKVHLKTITNKFSVIKYNIGILLINVSFRTPHKSSCHIITRNCKCVKDNIWFTFTNHLLRLRATEQSSALQFLFLVCIPGVP